MYLSLPRIFVFIVLYFHFLRKATVDSFLCRPLFLSSVVLKLNLVYCVFEKVYFTPFLCTRLNLQPVYATLLVSICCSVALQFSRQSFFVLANYLMLVNLVLVLDSTHWVIRNVVFVGNYSPVVFFGGEVFSLFL
jgi:hypothetical protein